MTRVLLFAALAVMILGFSNGTVAQSYPVRPITIVVPFPAGGPTDALTRLMAEEMSTRLGRPVLIENVTGAGGTIGTNRVVRASPAFNYPQFLPQRWHPTRCR